MKYIIGTFLVNLRQVTSHKSSVLNLYIYLLYYNDLLLYYLLYQITYYISSIYYLIEIFLPFADIIKFLLKCFFIIFFTIIIFFKNCFNKSINCIFFSVKNNLFTKFIINTNNVISKTARNMILVFFCV